MKTIPEEQQYLYYAICELVGIPTANELLDSGELAKYVANPIHHKEAL
jgi:hypothetical protein